MAHATRLFVAILVALAAGAPVPCQWLSLGRGNPWVTMLGGGNDGRLDRKVFCETGRHDLR